MTPTEGKVKSIEMKTEQNYYLESCFAFFLVLLDADFSLVVPS
jgi:hypothetical protein